MEYELTAKVRKDCGRCGATVVHEARVPTEHEMWSMDEKVNIAANRCETRFRREGWGSWSTIHTMCGQCHAYVHGRAKRED
jgi:hypothetical protein